MAEGEGVDALAVHGRTRAQLYREMADWELVDQIADALSIPVCGSGDVVDPESAKERLGSKVSGLFIGRASMWNPFVFGELVRGESSRLRGNHDLMLDVLLRYIELLVEDFPESSCPGKVKQLASQMCKGALWRKTLLGLNTLPEQRSLLMQAKAGEWTQPGRSSDISTDESESLESLSCDSFAGFSQ